jgi:hypothetical protein
MARLVPYFCEIQLIVSAGSTSASPVLPPSPPSPVQPASVALTVNAPAPSTRMNVRLLDVLFSLPVWLLLTMAI